jgi:hypothetical protein
MQKMNEKKLGSNALLKFPDPKIASDEKNV